MKKTQKIVISLFIFIQIILDMLRKTSIVNFEILNISIIELTNIILIGIIFFLVFFKNKKNIKKNLIYFAILLLYLGIHYYNTTLFNQNVYPLQNPNFIIECFHILITFGIPILALLSIKDSDLTKDDLISIIHYFSFFIAFLIVILNFLKFSYQAYDDGSLIQYNLFNWFTYQGNNYYELTSKGLFYSGNQISAILFICFPIQVLCLYKKRNFKNYLFLITSILAMYMLGTKVATYGVFLVLLAFFFIYLFSHFITKKNKQSITSFVIISIIACGFFLVSPLGINYRFYKEPIYEDLSKNDDFKKLQKLNCSDKSNLEKEKIFIESYIILHQDDLNIPYYIQKAYPVSYDICYWCNFIKNRNSSENDYRVMKTNILNSIYQRNNNKYDKLFGMGYTLNYLYTERDYTYQFYLYGIVGIILLICPYYFFCIRNGIVILKNLKKKATVENLLLLMAPVAGLFTAYLSGHIFERTLPLLIIAILTALSCKSLRE